MILGQALQCYIINGQMHIKLKHFNINIRGWVFFLELFDNFSNLTREARSITQATHQDCKQTLEYICPRAKQFVFCNCFNLVMIYIMVFIYLKVIRNIYRQ